ncbi:RIP metalloprotease RseP [Eikenella longinqua]|uniref:Zinc metalloprotease n=1 Tax=Eikenella longinqua TaxID=1795827 RepID=A0A1A9RTL5_9NEIS|nr:RIP metalloprotease RseP [Eikenella longinqua]OAM26125.1 RIP metalloprotease RseP [Eikenella longinqua]
MSLLYTVGAFIVAIMILVSLHELGHLLVARWCGIKVLRFSVGFGTPFFNKRWRNIEWCLAPIPLGGYVKMVDTREGDVPEADLPYAFDKQHPFKRILVVAAGPLTNLALAVLLYTFSFGHFGAQEVRPMVGMVAPESLAEKSGFAPGDTIQAVNGKAVATWGDAQSEIILNLDASKVQVAVRQANGQETVRTIDAAGTPEAKEVARRGGYFGLTALRKTTILATIQPGSPAERAGLRKGDRVVAIDGQIVHTWPELTTAIRRHPQDKLTVDILRGGKPFQVALRPDSREDRNGERYGFAGFDSETDRRWMSLATYRYHPSWPRAAEMGIERVGTYTALTGRLFARLLTGQASVSHISGPLTIADYAGKTAASGIQDYLEFLAVVSISLGILNLLPIPILDGVHLMYYAAEWIRGKPVSAKAQMWGLRFGLSLMLMLMLVAFFNDITRLLG